MQGGTSRNARADGALFGLPGRGGYERDVLVLGIGNILWADEGFGPRAVEAFHQKWRDMPDVLVEDGGTLGGYLINEITSSRRILVFDCCDFRREPGFLKVLRSEDLKLWATTKISPHQAGFNDLLATAALMGRMPEDVAVVGVQPAVLDDYGGSRSDLLKARIPPALALAEEVLGEWGHELTPRPEGEAPPALSGKTLRMDVYENERPSPEAACRFGDERFLARPGGHAVDVPFDPLKPKSGE